MNQVSLLIYLAGISGQLGGLLYFFGALFLILGVAHFLRSCAWFGEIDRWSTPEFKIEQINKISRHKIGLWLAVITACFLWLCAALMPSSNTVLAIAASQFGEQLMHTKTANLAEQALNSWLQNQITEVKVPAADAGKK